MGCCSASALTGLVVTASAAGTDQRAGMVPLGTHRGTGLLDGRLGVRVLKAFGSGGAAVTGVEAISNGVPAFRKPAWKNARDTLVIMGSLLGVMFLGLSILAAHDARDAVRRAARRP